ncbi:MAG: UvrD-helicase domain-containing protein [Elusimicrobia bacterium]|nr:UvrD-helicase domain-containing protein [Elusimicrobiota bacterium]
MGRRGGGPCWSENKVEDILSREQARSSLRRNVVVEAGAGTGKTTLLTDRLLFQALGFEPAVPLPAIVALTFTEKAAGEIKVRLSGRLGEIVAALSRPQAELPEIVARLREAFGLDAGLILEKARTALEELDRAQIGTIHSFASHLLRLYPVEAGVDPAFRVDEGDFFDELFESEWSRWLDTELGQEAPRKEAWLEVLDQAPLEDIKALARELSGERIDLEAVGRPAPEAARRLEQLAQRLEQAVAGRKPPRNSRVLESARAAAHRLRDLARESLAGPAAAGTASPGPVEALTHSRWPEEWGEEGAEAYEQALQAASEASPGSETLLRRACALALPFARHFRSLYNRLGYVSFDGLLRKARDLVRDHAEIREKLKERYVCLLIDEFQDTDPLQGELLLFLAERPGGRAARWQDIRLGSGRLFVVGDPKQSIYRFRGADIAAYQAFTGHVLAAGEGLSCDLKSNFRSSPALLRPVNAAFERIMRHRPGLQAAYKPLSAAKAFSPGSGISLVVLDRPEGREDFSAEAVQRAEAAWIAGWILEHCGPGRLYRFKDVAVLLRASTPLPALLETFKERKLPYAVEVERHFYSMQEVVDLVNLLRVLDEPENRSALAGLLRSPLGGVDDQALYRLARQGALDYLRPIPRQAGPEAKSALAPLYAALAELRAKVGRAPVGDIVQEILERTPMLELCAKAYFGEQTVSNLMKFARLAEQASDEGLTLKEFIARLSKQIKDSAREGESPLADEHLEAVRIMTIHKSKGLEFPVVFLSNASGGRTMPMSGVSALDWSSGLVGLRLPGCGAANAAMAWLSAENRKREASESVRLLYVAMTRAKERLFVVGKAKGDKAALSSWLRAAGAWPEPEQELTQLELGGSPISVSRVADPVDAPGRAAEPPEPGGGHAESPRSLAERWRRRLERCRELERSPWTRAPSAEQAFARGEEGAEFSGPREPALVGEACHRFLQGWDFRRGSGAPGELEDGVLKACQALKLRHLASNWSEVAAESLEILRGFVGSSVARELSAAEILGRELPFAYEEEGVVVRGVIDLVYRLEATVYVADYKSDKSVDKDPSKRRLKYSAQERAYRKAVERGLSIKETRFKVIFLRHPELSV